MDKTSRYAKYSKQGVVWGSAGARVTTLHPVKEVKQGSGVIGALVLVAGVLIAIGVLGGIVYIVAGSL